MDAKVFLDIVMTMIEYGMIDKNKLSDYEYVKERVMIYLEAKALAIETMNMSGMPI